MTFTSNFEGGNGTLLAHYDDASVETLVFLAQTKIGESAPMWFYFRVKNLSGLRVRFVIANAHQFLADSDVSAFVNDCPVFREPNSTWRRAANCRVTFNDPAPPCVSFEIENCPRD